MCFGKKRGQGICFCHGAFTSVIVLAGCSVFAAVRTILGWHERMCLEEMKTGRSCHFGISFATTKVVAVYPI